MARRKTLKKAQFQLFENCFHKDAQNKGRWHEVFGNEHPITLELGCGRAELSYGLAQKYPERNFLGIDLKADRLWRPGRDALREGLNNMAFLCIDLREMGQHLAPQEADEIWITFPDPFPKKRQAKHRMVNPDFLTLYQQVLKPGGKLHYKTDNLALFQYSLEVFVRQQNIHLHSLSFDLHADDNLPEDFKIKTTYEKQFMEMGIPINYVCFSFQE
jgi:tRNA (guanine-N7-)-methyltransferase